MSHTLTLVSNEAGGWVPLGVCHREDIHATGTTQNGTHRSNLNSAEAISGKCNYYDHDRATIKATAAAQRWKW